MNIGSIYFRQSLKFFLHLVRNVMSFRDCEAAIHINVQVYDQSCAGILCNYLVYLSLIHI